MERHAKDKMLIMVLTSILCAVIQVQSSPVEFSRKLKHADSPMDLDRNLRIVGGVMARVSQFPHAAALVLHLTRSRNPSFCGGSIIHPNYILTAAHCLVRLGINQNSGTSFQFIFLTSG